MSFTDRPKVVVVSVQGRGTLPAHSARRLEAVAEVTFLSRPDGLTGHAAAHAFAGAEVVAFTPKVAPPIDEGLLAGLPGLRGIALYATGFDFLDVELLEKYGVVLTHLPGYATTSVAEHALGLLLSLSRRIHLGHDRSRGRVPADTSLRGFELRGRTLGILGLGRIGSRFSQFGQALGMHVLGADVRPGYSPPKGVEVVRRDQLLERADAVTLLCSATYSSGPIVGAAELAAMRPGAVLVNASRSVLVDTEAVATAIRCGHLRGYAVDDTVCDPQRHADLLHEGRIVQTGHSAWWSDEVLTRGGDLWGESIRQLVLGRPLDVVHPTSRLPPIPSGTIRKVQAV